MIVLRILVADSGSDTGSQWQATQEEELSSKKKWCIQSESPNAMQFQCCSKTSLPLNGNFKHWKYIWTHRTCKVAYRDCSPQQMSWSPVQSLTKKSLLFWLSNLTGNVESSSETGEVAFATSGTQGLQELPNIAKSHSLQYTKWNAKILKYYRVWGTS